MVKNCCLIVGWALTFGLVWHYLLAGIVQILLPKKVFWTRNGMFFHPENRPASFFKDGEKVFFFNIRKIAHYYGTDDGLVTEVIPEGRNMGVIKPRQEEDESCVVRVAFDGGARITSL